MAWGQTTPLVLPSHSGLPSGVWGALPFLCVQHNSPTPLLSFVWNRTCLLCAFVDAAAVAMFTRFFADTCAAQGPGVDKLSKAQAGAVLNLSGLPTETLLQIWKLWWT